MIAQSYPLDIDGGKTDRKLAQRRIRNAPPVTGGTTPLRKAKDPVGIRKSLLLVNGISGKHIESLVFSEPTFAYEKNNTRECLQTSA